MVWLVGATLLDDLDGMAHAATFEGWPDALKADAYGLFRPIKNAIFYSFSQQEEINLTTWHSLFLGSFLTSIAAVFFLLRALFKSDLGALIGATVWSLTPT